ncbi:methyltransferase domain-containing protein [Amycolatopsis balhimycina DSM 5908]|uniref:Protein-L-isoaspartate O-methyltransferase n=1 Tax=Amycolatopsis balhimycina DSM 5908 TaxID=1081091 RepID=A0A428WTK3_AMYBA|nr:methyltransferase domain-containing protein [Amycolatopsis balhimycina]RSM46382.1 methyltransferase domain-containing protein [Amycolatopsis balhimycina DSM 5908]
MDVLDTAAWETRAVALADALATAGVLSDQAWRAAFAATPRHLFVPRILDGPASLGAGDPGWLDAVYADEALATQTRPAGDGAAGRPIASSSSSKPTVMAVMLERLAAEPGHRVLEIGTGTGYNAALLSHRLGADNVYSLDLDPELVDAASDRLAAAGYNPHLAAGDGFAGWPGEITFDRIIATCAVTAIPPAWIDQLADGGRIVAPLDAGAAGPLLVLDKTADDEVSGRIDPFPVLFMPMRADVASPFGPGQEPSVATSAIPHYGSTAVDPAALLDRPELALFLWLHAPGLRLAGSAAHGVVVAERGPARAEVDVTPVAEGTWVVRQSGPYRLWDTVEHAVAAFDALGEPDAARLGVTALNVPGKQYVWLDDPDRDHCWPLGCSG